MLCNLSVGLISVYLFLETFSQRRISIVWFLEISTRVIVVREC